MAKYTPQSKTTELAFQKLLEIVQSKMGDQPHEVFQQASEILIGIMKDEKSVEAVKREEIKTELFFDISGTEYTNIIKIINQLTDWEDLTMGASNIEAETAPDEGIAVVFDDEEEDKIVEKYTKEIFEEEEEGETMEIEDYDKESNKEKEDQIIERFDLNNVDYDWLIRKLNEYYKDEKTCQSIAADVLDILNKEDRECEDYLAEILGFDKKDLILTFMQNREAIYYRIKYLQASEKEKQSLESTIRSYPIIAKSLGIGMIDVNGSASLISNQKRKHEGLVAELLDLESLSFKQGSHLSSSSVKKYPKGTKQITQKGYEEIHIPSSLPKPFSKSEKLIPIAELPDWMHPAFKGITQLNRVQSALCSYALKEEENLLLCAPTSAGKTNVAMLTILNTISKFRVNNKIRYDAFKIVYLAPMKSLVSEVVENFSNRLKPLGIVVHELTGDVSMTKAQLEETQLIVATPEKWDIITRRTGERTYTQLVRLVIIDEIHLLHDERGPVLESIIARTLRQVEQTQELVRLVGLSATLPNYEDVAQFMRVNLSKGLFAFDNSYRPVPLELEYCGIKEKGILKKIKLINDLCYDRIFKYAKNNQQSLIFVHSRKETAKTARNMMEFAKEREELPHFLGDSQVSAKLEEYASVATDRDLRELLKYGFGIHHAGMNRNDRELVEGLFEQKFLKVLVSTATLAWGVNLPAHTVIIKGTQIYDPRIGGWTELSPLDVMQMLGRAGRPQHDTSGNGIILTSYQEMKFYCSLMVQQLPVESQFVSKIVDNLNAEIVLGTVQNINDAVEWLGYTYLYVRMLRNPYLYRLTRAEIESDSKLRQRRLNLVHTAASILSRAGMIIYDSKAGTLMPTDLGVVGAHYYVSHESISAYLDQIQPNMHDIDIFRLFSSSREFSGVPVRTEEKLELVRLLQGGERGYSGCPIPVREPIEDPTAKINVLLQSYISRLHLDGFALISDMVFITQSGGRLFGAIFEIVLKRGWAELAVRCLEIKKMLAHRLWRSQSPLRQFKKVFNIPEEIISKLEKKDYPWEGLFSLQPELLGTLVPPKYANNFYKILHMIPKLDLSVAVQPISRETLKLELQITPDFQYNYEISGASEPFWVLIEDCDQQKILHSELYLLKKKFSHEPQILTFIIPITSPLPPQYFVRVVSDRWLGIESLLPVPLINLILPSKFSSLVEYNEKISRVKISMLKDPAHINLYSAFGSEFNTLESQVFNDLYETDNSILIGASNGIGKTTSSEFAILRLIQSEKDFRVVYLSPIQDLSNHRYFEWNQKFGINGLGLKVVQLTGESSTDVSLVNMNQIIISTYEQWDKISRRWKQRRAVQQISLFIADEIHMLSGLPGPIMEIVLSRIRYVGTQTGTPSRIIALGCPIANASDISNWLDISSNSVYNYHTSNRALPMQIKLQTFWVDQFQARQFAMLKPVYSILKSHFRQYSNKPCAVFVPTLSLSQSIPIEILSLAASQGTPEIFRRGDENQINKVIETSNINNSNLISSLQLGIGYYNDGLSVDEKRVVLRLYMSGIISVLFISHSSLWSIPVKCHTLIVMDTQYYEGREHRYVDYSIPDILQMIGLSGRPIYDDSSRAFILCHASKRDFLKQFLFEPLPIESHLDAMLAEHLNAEIVSKVIQNKQHAVDYLTWTLLYRRISKNPMYYNLLDTSHIHISEYLSELVETTLDSLASSHSIVIENDFDLIPLNLGIIASYYYIHYETVEIFGSSISNTINLKGLFEILSNSVEFETLKIRHREDKLMQSLALHLPLSVKSNTFIEHFAKVQILLQCHFGRRILPSELSNDLNIILKKSHSLLQALVDVIASNGWLKPALVTMELSQMITQAQWHTDSPLKQIPWFNDQIIEKAKQMEVSGVVDILDMEEEDRSQLLADLSEEQVAQIAQVANQFPSIDLEWNILDSDDIHEGENVTIQFKLSREDEDIEETEIGLVHAPYFPVKKIESWWLVIGKVSSNSLLTLKRFPMKLNHSVELVFTAPEEGTHEIAIYLMSDSWIGGDSKYSANINVKEQLSSSEEEESNGDSDYVPSDEDVSMD